MIASGRVFGSIFLVHQAGSASGAWLAGFLFETGGGHGTAFAISCTILMLAALVSLRIDERPRRVTALAPAAGGD